MPLILYLSIGRRMYYNRDEAEDPTGEIMGAVCYSFLPPDSTSKWPKTIDDIGNDQVQWLLKCAKNGAAGSRPLLRNFVNVSSLQREGVHR